MGIILRLIREIYFKMKISALIFSAASAQYAETEAATATAAPETPAPAPVEVYNCFPANGDGVTPCGCQWNTLETFENKTCTVTFGDSGANILQFQAHGGWTQGNYGGAQGTYIFHGIDGMSAELLNMNWFFSLESGECCNDEMPLKEDGSCYYNKTMNPAEWAPEISCVDNAGAYPTPVFSAFNSNWRPQASYNVQVIRSASDVAAGTFEFNDGVALGNATVGGVTPVTVTGGDVAAVFNVDSTANSQQIEAYITSDSGVPDAFNCKFTEA